MDKLNESLENGYTFRLNYYIQRAWDLFKLDAGIYIGMLFFFWFIYMFASLLPFVGFFAGAILVPYSFGFFLTAQKNDKGENQTFSSFFDGYKKGGELIGSYIIILIIALIALIPLFFFLEFNTIFSIITENSEDQFAMSNSLANHLVNKIGILLLYFFVYAFVLYLCFTWYAQLIVFKNQTIGESLKNSIRLGMKNPGQMILLFLVLFGINLIGLLLIGIGLIVTIPMSFIIQYLAFKDIALDEEQESLEQISDYLV